MPKMPVNKMKDISYRVGDLVRHTTYLHSKNKGWGIVIKVIPVAYLKVNSVKIHWFDGTRTWAARSQIELYARGQDGEIS